MKIFAITTVIALLGVSANALSNTYLPPQASSSNSISSYAAPASYAAPSVSHVSFAPAPSRHVVPSGGGFGGFGAASAQHVNYAAAPSFHVAAPRPQVYQAPVPAASHNVAVFAAPAPRPQLGFASSGGFGSFGSASGQQASYAAAPAPRVQVHHAPVAAASNVAYSAPVLRPQVYQAPVVAATRVVPAFAPAPRPVAAYSAPAISFAGGFGGQGAASNSHASYAAPVRAASNVRYGYSAPVVAASAPQVAYVAPAPAPVQVAAPSNIQQIVAAGSSNYGTKYAANGGYEYRYKHRN
nr:cuticle protein 16.5 [Bactrocera oleae]